MQDSIKISSLCVITVHTTVLFNTLGNGSFSSTIICNDFHNVSLIKISFTTELFHLLFIFKYTQYVLVNKKRTFKNVFARIVFSISKSAVFVCSQVENLIHNNFSLPLHWHSLCLENLRTQIKRRVAYPVVQLRGHLWD